MMARHQRHRIFSRLVLLGLLLRVVVPAGYMPTGMADGWYLKLCPDGMPASVMMALFGHDHHHHPSTTELGSEGTLTQCDLGGGLSADFAHVASAATEVETTTDINAVADDFSLLILSRFSPYRPRSPPIS